jgi:hypothetical protein
MLCWAVWTPGKMTRTRRLGASGYFSVSTLHGQVGEVAGDGEERSLTKHWQDKQRNPHFFSFFSERKDSSPAKIVYTCNWSGRVRNDTNKFRFNFLKKSSFHLRRLYILATCIVPNNL